MGIFRRSQPQIQEEDGVARVEVVLCMCRIKLMDEPAFYDQWTSFYNCISNVCGCTSYAKQSCLPNGLQPPHFMNEWQIISTFIWDLQFLSNLIKSDDACISRYHSSPHRCLLIHLQTLILSIDFDRPSNSLRSSPELYVDLINTQMFDTVCLFRLLNKFDIFRSKHNPLSFRVLT